MNKRFIIMLCIALLLAFCAAWIANLWMQSRPLVNTVPIVVAAVEIPEGTTLEDFHVKLVDWPSTLVPSGVFSSKDQVINKITKNTFYADEPFSENRMAIHKAGSTLSAMINHDYRAISVRVDDVVGVAGFILPGNHVDVLATRMDKELNKSVTQTKLQNIRVLAVDQDDSHEKDKPAIVRAVTLELKPEQAEVIVQAMREGTIQLTLRNPEDKEIVIVNDKIQEITPPVADKTIQKKRHYIKIIPW